MVKTYANLANTVIDAKTSYEEFLAIRKVNKSNKVVATLATGEQVIELSCHFRDPAFYLQDDKNKRIRKLVLKRGYSVSGNDAEAEQRRRASIRTNYDYEAVVEKNGRRIHMFFNGVNQFYSH